MLEVNNLVYQPGLVEGLSFSLCKGEVLGLLGPNGAGKTTTLNCVAGLAFPHSGSIKIEYKDIWQHQLWAKKRIGFLPEIPPLYSELRVNEFLYHIAEMRGIQQDEIAQSIEKVSERCSLQNVRHQLIRTLSKGFRQRLSLAQAIIHEPSVLILDEPTDGLDPIQVQLFRALLDDLKKSCGILLATHQLAEVEAVCTHVLVLNKGKMIYSDSMANAVPESSPMWLRLANSVACEQIETLPAVKQVISQHGNWYKLELDHEFMQQGSELPASLHRSLLDNEMYVVEMHYAKSFLEELFVGLLKDTRFKKLAQSQPSEEFSY